MKNKKISKKIICIILSLLLMLSVLPMTFMTSYATSSGNQTYSKSVTGALIHSSLEFKLLNASDVSGDTVTYVVDRFFHKDMSSLGNVYYANFGVNCVVFSSSFESTGYKLSNEFKNVNQIVNTSKNTAANSEQSGSFIGEVPAVGETVEFKLTVNLSAQYKHNNGTYPVDTCSASANIKVIGVDSTELQRLLINSQNLRKECWTSVSWSAYSSALNTAKTVAADASALQPAIDSAAKKLADAKKGLVHNGAITKCDYCAGKSQGISLEPTAYKSIVYGQDVTRQSLNLYLPSNMQGEVPLMLFIHGGAWISGDKSDFDSDAYYNCKKYGIATATISYRYTSQTVDIYDILDDVEASLIKIKQIASENGLDIKKMMLCGFSAGAHICLMYGYTRINTAPITPVCIFDKSGPTNLTGSEYLNKDNSNLNTWVTLFGAVCGQTFTYDNRLDAAQALMDASPVYQVTKDCIPTLIGVGLKDSIVPYQQAQVLDQRLTEEGAPHDMVIFPNSEHGLDSDPSSAEQLNTLFDAYVKTYLIDKMPTAVHNFETETVAKTCTTDGYTLYSCIDCGKYFVSDVVPASHTPGTAQKINEKSPTCTADGGYDEVVTCTSCLKELSKAHYTLNKLSHSPDTPVKEYEKAPTCLLNGSYEEVVYCKTCKVEISREKKTVNKLPHTEGTPVKENKKTGSCVKKGTYDEVVYCTVCKREVSRTQKESDYGKHVQGLPVRENEVPSTCIKQGSYDEVVYCTVCKNEVSRTAKALALAPHTPNTAVKENEVPSTCSKAGSYDEVVYCTVCKNELTRTPKALELAAHTPGEWVVSTPATTTAPGLEVQKCSVCTQVIDSREIPQITEIKITAKDGSGLTIDDTYNMIFGVPEGSVDIDDLIEKVNCTVKYEETASGFGTGTLVKVMDAQKLVKTYTIVVPYDVTGDGYCDVFDVALLSSVANYENEFEENSAYFFAGDIAKDDFIDVFDLSQITAKANYEF